MTTMLQMKPSEEYAIDTIQAHVQPVLPADRIRGLLHAIDRNLPARDDGGCPIVHFISAYKSEGADLIAFETAVVAARGGKRVLFVDTCAGKSSLPKRLRINTDVQLHGGGRGVSPFLQVEGTSLFLAVLPESAGAPDVALIQTLRKRFDLIAIYSEGALVCPLALTLFGLADGCILVAEAERTRIPVIKRLQALVNTNGGRTIGAVLNKRKFHIPGLVYSLFFGS